MLGVSKRTIERRMTQLLLANRSQYTDIEDDMLDSFVPRIIANFPRSGKWQQIFSSLHYFNTVGFLQYLKVFSVYSLYYGTVQLSIKRRLDCHFAWNCLTFLLPLLNRYEDYRQLFRLIGYTCAEGDIKEFNEESCCCWSLDMDNEDHLFCLHFVYKPLINQMLSNFTNLENGLQKGMQTSSILRKWLLRFLLLFILIFSCHVNLCHAGFASFL